MAMSKSDIGCSLVLRLPSTCEMEYGNETRLGMDYGNETRLEKSMGMRLGWEWSMGMRLGWCIQHWKGLIATKPELIYLVLPEDKECPGC